MSKSGQLIHRITSKIWFHGHTLQCRLARRAARQQIREYIRQFPNYCKSCGGWGGVSFAGGYDHPPEFDACDVPEDERTCHQCGRLGLTAEDADGPCMFCGWDYNDGIPELDQYCGCEQMRDYAARELL